MKRAKKKTGKAKASNKRNAKPAKPAEHFMRVKFGVLSDNRPEIYEFFYSYLPKILQKTKQTRVGLKIERLEALDEKHVNLPLKSREQIRHALLKFTLSHAMHRQHNNLTAVLPVKKLSQTLRDYDVLFDLFFTDLTIASKKFKIEMMDGFYNSLLLAGKIRDLERIKQMMQKNLLQQKAEFKLVDHSKNWGKT